MTRATDIHEHLARFALALRGGGIDARLGDEIDAASALQHIDMMDAAEVRLGLRIAFKVPREAWPSFDELFDRVWGVASQRTVRPPPALTRDHRGARLGSQWRWDGVRVRLELPDDEPPPDGEQPGYSAGAMLRRKPFEEIAPRELAAMERLLAALALRLAARRSRRLVPTRSRGVVDLRRSFRRAVATDGEFLRLARRARTFDEPRVVLLYDTSGSMDPTMRFHLCFAFALRRVIGKHAEIFTFNTGLTRVTREIVPTNLAGSLARLAAGVPDWSGGTRIGPCLAEFVGTYADRMVGRATTIVIVSDGLDLQDGALLAEAMQALRSRAREIIWLNPLAGDARFEPTAAGMRAALPHVDHFGPAHNFESLERLVRLLR